MRVHTHFSFCYSRIIIRNKICRMALTIPLMCLWYQYSICYHSTMKWLRISLIIELRFFLQLKWKFDFLNGKIRYLWWFDTLDWSFEIRLKSTLKNRRSDSNWPPILFPLKTFDSKMLMKNWGAIDWVATTFKTKP